MSSDGHFFDILINEKMLERKLMFKKEERTGLIVYLYYNRDVKKIETIGDIVYHSKKHRYLQLYIPTEQVEETMQKLSKENMSNKYGFVTFKNWTQTLLETCLEIKKT